MVDYWTQIPKRSILNVMGIIVGFGGRALKYYLLTVTLIFKLHFLKIKLLQHHYYRHFFVVICENFTADIENI